MVIMQFVPASVREQASPHALLWINRAERGGTWSVGVSPRPTHSGIRGKVSTAVFSNHVLEQF